MGYYTQYDLDVIGTDTEIPDSLIQECKKYGIAVTSNVDHKKAISEQSEYHSVWDDEIKWYSHEDDMRFYSTQHPSLIFKLIGEGEESGDMWVKYFKNGKMQLSKAKIVFDEFDEAKLR